MKILIEVIPHSHQRYDTCGDWQFTDPKPTDNKWTTFVPALLSIKVSKTHSYKYEFLISIHELIEAVLCYTKGIKEEDVDRFDNQGGPTSIHREPGDDPRAPYHRQHMIASAIERLLAIELGVSWPDYEEHLDKLEWRPPAMQSVKVEEHILGGEAGHAKCPQCQHLFPISWEGRRQV